MLAYNPSFFRANKLFNAGANTFFTESSQQSFVTHFARWLTSRKINHY